MIKVWINSRVTLRRHLHTTSSLRNNITYLPCPPEFERNTKPLVLLFGWLFAKGRHLERYGRLYQELAGADVLVTKMEVPEILRPKKASKVASQVLEELISPEIQDKPVIVHGLSVGGYLYSHVLKNMITQDKYQPVRKRIIGQVYDSPVDFAGVPHGIANATTENVLLRSLMTFSINSYLNLTYRFTKKIYLEQSDLFHNKPVHCPSLFLFSKDDIIADAKTIENCQLGYRKLGIPVTSQCWDSSPHVSHFHVHPKEYTKIVSEFVKNLNI